MIPENCSMSQYKLHRRLRSTASNSESVVAKYDAVLGTQSSTMSAYGMNIPEKVNKLSGQPATLS